MFRRAVNSCYGMGYWPNRNREHVLTRLDDVLRSISLKVPGVVRLKARLECRAMCSLLAATMPQHTRKCKGVGVRC